MSEKEPNGRYNKKCKTLNKSNYKGIKSIKFSLGWTIDLGKKSHNLSNKL